MTVCGPKLTCFWVWWSIDLGFVFVFVFVVVEIDSFLYAGRKSFGVSIEIDLFFVWVVDIDLISVWGIELDLPSF